MKGVTAASFDRTMPIDQSNVMCSTDHQQRRADRIKTVAR